MPAEIVAAAGEDEDDVAEQQREGGLSEDAMCPVHAVEAAEERLDGPQSRAEHEVERERRRAGERAQDRDARQAGVGAAEASVERRDPQPEDDRRRRSSTTSTSGPRRGASLVSVVAPPISRRYVSFCLRAYHKTIRLV